MQLPEAVEPLLRVWRHRNYACFMGGMTPCLVTLWMQRIGTLWLAWELTHSNAWVGAIVAADYAPMLFMAPFVGAFVDRSDPVSVQRVTQWLTLVLSAAMAVLIFSGLMSIWMLLVLSLVLGCVHPFNAISRHSIIPRTVPKSEIPTALATDSALFNASRFIGPALAGFMITALGVGSTFAANSIGCALYLVGIYAMNLAPPERRDHGRTGMLGDVKEGLVYVRGHAGIGPMFLLLAVGAIWIRPLQDLLPGFAAQVFEAGPSGLSWLMASMGVGATISAALIAMYAHTSGLTLAVLLAFAANIAASLAFVATSNLYVAMVVGAIWGGSLTMMSTGAQALVQSSVDNALRGRVMSLYTMIYRGAPFLGALIVGAAADYIGLRLAFGVAVLLCVLPWLAAMRQRTSMTLALEGRSNDLDQRLMAATRSWAGLHHEYLADIRQRARTVGIGVQSRHVMAGGAEIGARLIETGWRAGSRVFAKVQAFTGRLR